jgi:predicted nucleic acid-binding protein
MLDSSPLSLLCHPNPTAAGVIEINLWLQSLLAAGAEIFIPEIADYEVRRELLRAGKQKSLRRLGLLIGTLHYVPISTAHMNRAAELWAGARNRGIPTAPPEALDGDVILAAQAESTAAVVATANVTHLSRFVSAKHWRDITQP